MKKHLLILFVLNLLILPVLAQSTKPAHDRSSKWYVYWGWNRGWYTNSDLHLQGDGYNFNLADVKAQDRPSELSLKNYLFFTSLTVPQTNVKAGYHFSDKYSVALGFDHMKYVVEQYQTTIIDGTINVGDSEYNGTYQNQEIELKRNFLRYEHTDGLNYVFLEFNRHDRLLDKDKLQISTVFGASPAFLRPRTDVTFLNVQGPNVYHFAGYGINAKFGLDILLFNRLSLMSEVKGGYINLPDVRATLNPNEKVSQHFSFLQANFILGFVFSVK